MALKKISPTMARRVTPKTPSTHSALHELMLGVISETLDEGFITCKKYEVTSKTLRCMILLLSSTFPVVDYVASALRPLSGIHGRPCSIWMDPTNYINQETEMPLSVPKFN